MPNLDECKHDLLLIITIALFILLATGLAAGPITPGQALIVSSGNNC